MAVSTVPVRFVRRRLGETARRDVWWIQPLVVFLGLSTFVVYATWAAFQGDHYTYGPYLSPFYSPELFGSSPHSWFGPKPASWPGWLPFSPALLILPIPAFFRVTCYYYRGAYYKAFWADPAVVHRRRAAFELLGRELVSARPAERPSLHAVPFGRVLLILAFDVWKAFWFTDPATGAVSFGIGVGTLVLATNAVLLSGYLFGCHSMRHVVGGCVDRVLARAARSAGVRRA